MRPRLLLLTVAAGAALPWVGSTAPTSLPVRLSVSVVPTRVTGGDSASGTVTLKAATAPPRAVAVALSSNDPAVRVPARVTVAAHRTSASFVIVTSPVARTALARVTASAGAPAWASLEVRPPRLAAIEIPPGLHSNEEFTGTLTLSGRAPEGGCTVILRAQAPGGYLSYPLSVSVEAGQTKAEFTGHTGTIPSERSGQIVAEAGGSVIPAGTRLMP